jgi:nucleoid-associated protein YgaU
MYRLFLGSLIIALLTFGCSKEVVQDEPVAEQTTQVQQPQVDTVVVAQPEPEPIVEEPVVAVVESLEEKEGKLEEVLELVAEGDSIDIFYMVRPGDYLSLIAKNEYGNIAMWRMIYKWNRKKIGANPNLIYPFHEFLLKKPKETAKDLEYDFYDYTVKSGESLWSIAGKEYNNSYAWIIILRDNADVLGANLQKISAGTILKLRTNLF